jgi:LMBR1 domain-containing protein 1
MDVFMIVMTCVLAVLLLIVNIYLLAYYCHPDDRGFGSSLICKVVVVMGMTLSWAQVLMLPLDVSNARSFGGGIRMDLFWEIVYLATAVMVLIIIPALTFWYESDPDWTCWEKTKYSFCYLFATIIVVIIILVVTYAFLSTAYIPVKTISCKINNIQKSSDPITEKSYVESNCIIEKTELPVDVSFPIYVIGMMSFISWFLFVLFGGVGMAALPLDFFYDFCTRPKKLSRNDMEIHKNKVAERAKLVKEFATEAKEMENRDVAKAGCKIS